MSSGGGEKGQKDNDFEEGNPLLIPLVPTGQQLSRGSPDTVRQRETEIGKHVKKITNDDPEACGPDGKPSDRDASKEGNGKNEIENGKETKENESKENGKKYEEENGTKVENGKQNKENDKEIMDNGGEVKENGSISNRSTRSRRIGITTAPPAHQHTKQRKISFADDVEQRFPLTASDDHLDEEVTDIIQDVIPEIEDSYIDQHPISSPKSSPAPKNNRSFSEIEEDKDKFPFLSKREARFSTASRFSLNSRPSFAGLPSIASMASIKSTLTKVSSELYPERGSFIAHGLGQSFAELPEVFAKKIYIITQVLAAVSVSIGSMAVGFNAAYTSPALASMNEPNSTLTVTEEQESWIGSLMPLSALVGSILGGYLVDALGRKMLILICGPPLFAAMIIIGSAVNVWMLYVGRSMAGLCVGLLSLTLPVYLGETIQPEIRGTLGLLPTTIGNTGILFCYVVGSYVNWSWLAYIGALIPLVFFCMMIFVPETPRWYVSKGQDENAERSLCWLRGSDNDVQFELEAIQQNFDLCTAESSSLKDLFKKSYVKPLLLSISLMLVQQLSGINAVIFYTVDIFKLSGSKIDENLCTIIVGVVNFLSTFVANILIDKLGRKILLYISGVSMIISLFSLGTYFYLQALSDPTDSLNEWNSTMETISWLPLLSFMIYVIAFSLGWGPIPWLFMGEALPAKIRGPAASLATALNWGCTSIVTKTFPGLIKELGPSNVFYMFGGVMVVGFIFSIFFVPETKGKTLEEIEAQLSGRPKYDPSRRYSEISGIVIK